MPALDLSPNASERAPHARAVPQLTTQASAHASAAEQQCSPPNGAARAGSAPLTAIVHPPPRSYSAAHMLPRAVPHTVHPSRLAANEDAAMLAFAADRPRAASSVPGCLPYPPPSAAARSLAPALNAVAAHFGRHVHPSRRTQLDTPVDQSEPVRHTSPLRSATKGTTQTGAVDEWQLVVTRHRSRSPTRRVQAPPLRRVVLRFPPHHPHRRKADAHRGRA